MDCGMPGFSFSVLHCLPRVYSNSCPLGWWGYPNISVIHFSSCLQFFLASGSFPMSWLFASGGQSIGTSASSSVLLMNIQDLFPLGLTGSVFFKGDFKEFVYLWTGFNTTSLSKPLSALKRQWYNRGVRALWGPGFPPKPYSKPVLPPQLLPPLLPGNSIHSMEQEIVII